MKLRIITLIASLAVVAALLTSQGSFAWFVTSVKKAQSITIGLVNFNSDAVALDTLEEDYYGKACIYPGQNLVVYENEDASLAMYNSSTIDTQIRVRIEYTSYAKGKPETKIYKGDEDEDLEVVFAGNGAWLPYDNGMDGCCFYYVGENSGITKISDTSKAFQITPDITSVDIIKSVGYKKDIDTSLYSGNEVTLNIIFEAKQADYVGWSSVGEYQVDSSVN